MKKVTLTESEKVIMNAITDIYIKLPIRESKLVLAKIYNDINCWEMPEEFKDLNIPEKEFGINGHSISNIKILNYIESLIGERAISYQWNVLGRNKHMTKREFFWWWLFNNF